MSHITIAMLLLLPRLAWGFWGADNYHECILKEMPGGKNVPYVVALIESCRKQFPDTRSRYAEEIKRTMGVADANECILKFAKNESLAQSAAVIHEACHALFPKNPESAPRPESKPAPQSITPKLPARPLSQSFPARIPDALPPFPPLQVVSDHRSTPPPPTIGRSAPRGVAEIAGIGSSSTQPTEIQKSFYELQLERTPKTEPVTIPKIAPQPLAVQAIAEPGGAGFTWMRGGIVPSEKQPKYEQPAMNDKNGARSVERGSGVTSSNREAEGKLNSRRAEETSSNALMLLDTFPEVRKFFKATMVARANGASRQLDTTLIEQICSSRTSRVAVDPPCRRFAVAVRDAGDYGYRALVGGIPITAMPSYRALMLRMAQISCRLNAEQADLLAQVFDYSAGGKLPQENPQGDLARVRACAENL